MSDTNPDPSRRPRKSSEIDPDAMESPTSSPDASEVNAAKEVAADGMDAATTSGTRPRAKGEPT